MRHHKYILPIVLAFVAFSGRASAAEPQWVEVRSPNFRVVTDAGEKRGREVALRFEQMRNVFSILFNKAKVQTGTPLTIVAFKNSKGLRQVAKRFEGKVVQMAGFFQAGNGVTYIALDLSSPNKWDAIFHEYGHMLLNANSIDAPLWFDEGFAEFFSTVEVSKSSFQVGTVPEHIPYVLVNQRLMPVTELFAINHNSKTYNIGNHRSLFYAQSWLAMNYLWFKPERTKKTQAYMDLVKQNVPIADAIRQAYGMEPKQLDAELDKHLRTGTTAINTYKVALGDDLQYKVTPVPALDARAILADMQFQSASNFEAGLREFEEILKADPNHPMALTGVGFGYLRKNEHDKAGPYFRRAASLELTNPLVYYQAAFSMYQIGGANDADTRKEIRRVLEKAVALDPNYADAYNALALTAAADDDYEAALRHIGKALELEPRNERFQESQGIFYLNNHKSDEAERVFKRLAGSGDPIIASRAQRMLEDLQRMGQGRAQFITPTGAGEPAEEIELEEKEESDEQFFITGRLLNVECQGSGAVFHIGAGKEIYKLAAPDLSLVSFGGTTEFTCAKQDRAVEGYYMKKSDGRLMLVALKIK